MVEARCFPRLLLPRLEEAQAGCRNTTVAQDVQHCDLTIISIDEFYVLSMVTIHSNLLQGCFLLKIFTHPHINIERSTYWVDYAWRVFFHFLRRNSFVHTRFPPNSWELQYHNSCVSIELSNCYVTGFFIPNINMQRDILMLQLDEVLRNVEYFNILYNKHVIFYLVLKHHFPIQNVYLFNNTCQRDFFVFLHQIRYSQYVHLKEYKY